MFSFLKRVFVRGVKSDSVSSFAVPKLKQPKFVLNPNRSRISAEIKRPEVVSVVGVRKTDNVLSESEKRLSAACLGDRSKADRLISYEMKRDSSVSRSVAVKRALDRLADDRR